MPSHSASTVDRIKERLSIEDVVGSYIKLEKAGRNLKGRCPFHNEKTPSFFVSPERGSFYCFGCNAKGDIFSFVEQFEGLDFMGALKLLAQRAGVELVFDKNSHIQKSEKEKMYSIMEEATVFFEKELRKSKEAQEYLKGRGITGETAKNFRIGFVPNEWRLLYDYLKSKKYSDNEIEKAGLAKRPEGGDGQKMPYDRFRGRVMFPICDSSGRAIAFSGRMLVDDGKSAKYLNSPDTPLYNKSTVLYGIDKAKHDIRVKNYSIMVEGQMDLVLSHQVGIKNTVAVSGTALSDTLMSKDKVVNNLGIVKRLSNNVILAFDSDTAGQKAAMRSASIALSLGMDVKIAKIEGGKDPADLIKENPNLWKDTLRNSTPVVEFALNNVLLQKLDPRKLPQALRDNVFPFIAPIAGAMEKAHYVKLIREKTGLSEDSIVSDLKKVEEIQKNGIKEVKAIESAKSSLSRLDNISRRLFGLIFYLKKNKISDFDVNDFETAVKKIAGDEKFTDLLRHGELNSDELLFEAEMSYGDSINKGDFAKMKKELNELLLNFEEDVLKQEFSETMAKLALSEKNKNEKLSGDLMKKCQVLSVHISQLSKKKDNH